MIGVILTKESIYDIIMVTQGHLQGQKVNSKDKTAKICFLTITNSSKRNTSFWCVFDTRINL